MPIFPSRPRASSPGARDPIEDAIGNLTTGAGWRASKGFVILLAAMLGVRHPSGRRPRRNPPIGRLREHPFATQRRGN
jgi:hypothetical protein